MLKTDDAEALLAVLPAAPDCARRSPHGCVISRIERRLSPHSLDAYGRDVRQFLSFLCERFGAPPTIADFVAPRAGRSARLSGASARRGRRGPLAAARAGLAALAGATPRARRRRPRLGLLGDPGAAPGAQPAQAAGRRRRQSDDRSANPRRRSARSVDFGARRGGARLALWRGPAHQRGAVDPPPRCAGRRPRQRDDRRQGSARRAARRSSRRCARLWRTISLFAPMR